MPLEGRRACGAEGAHVLEGESKPARLTAKGAAPGGENFNPRAQAGVPVPLEGRRACGAEGAQTKVCATGG